MRLQATPLRASSKDEALYELLDTLIAVKIDLCGVNGNPSQASLDEARFQQACQALAEGIVLLQNLVADADGGSPLLTSLSQRDDGQQFPGRLPERANRRATNYGNAYPRGRETSYGRPDEKPHGNA